MCECVYDMCEQMGATSVSKCLNLKHALMRTRDAIQMVILERNQCKLEGVGVIINTADVALGQSADRATSRAPINGTCGAHYATRTAEA